MKKGLIYGALVLLLLAGLALMLVPPYLENDTNVVQRDTPWPVSDTARKLHATLRIADLHADTLLWKRSLLKDSDIGHVDLPRLQRGGVVLQVMSAVTKSPQGQNYDSNSTQANDLITPLAMVQLWPPRTWDSLLQRALYQAQKLREAEARSADLHIVRNAAQLNTFLQQRSDQAVATLLATEGAHPLEGEIGNLQLLWDAGYRMLGLHHFFDNRLGGSLHGESRSGLTEFGRQVVRQAIDMGFIIDVAHSSPASVDEVLQILQTRGRPLVVSHTGMHGTCNSPRNLSDEQMQRIARAGGLIGVGYWDAVCDITPAGVARSIAYAVDLLGVEHVALGSDYDGATTVTFDTSQLAVLTQALLDEGLSDDQIRRVMGENQLQFLLANLP